MDMKLEVTVIAVSDPDRAKQFYKSLGWREDADFTFGEDQRVVQLTPPGSPASVHFGLGWTTAAPGSARSYLIVDDIEEARTEVMSRGVEVSDVYHREGAQARVPGPAPDRASYGSLASFADPDGNTWVLQEITERLPGRVDAAATRYVSVDDLAAALRWAAQAHGEHEARLGEADPNWPDWYASYMAHEQAGDGLPS
jgi:catechol 2,3-dioxygenase-like lactoylglutathione lyase family enzyme